MGAFDMIKSKTKDDDEVKEDPIQKAEREFFEIIKKVVIILLLPSYLYFVSFHNCLNLFLF